MMYQILQHIRDSQNLKVGLLLGFCFITTIIFISQSGDQPHSEKLKKLPSVHEMSSEEDEFPGEVMTGGGMPGEQMVGGLGKLYEKDTEVDEVVAQIKPVLEEKSGKKFESLEVIHYRPQTVAGKNYFVKAKAKMAEGGEQIVHLRIYRDIRRKLELTAFQLDKKLEEKLEYFQ